MLAKAAEAQAAAKSQATGGIQHKPAEKLSRRERERLQEKLRAKEQAAKKSQPQQDDRSRSGTPLNKPGAAKKPELSYKGTMKKPAHLSTAKSRSCMSSFLQRLPLHTTKPLVKLSIPRPAVEN